MKRDDPVRELQERMRSVGFARTNHVYFIAGAGLVKIGWSRDLWKRLDALQSGSPVELKILSAVPGDEDYEHELHERWAPLRRHGEWFELTKDLAAFVRETRQDVFRQRRAYEMNVKLLHRVRGIRSRYSAEINARVPDPGGVIMCDPDGRFERQPIDDAGEIQRFEEFLERQRRKRKGR